MLVPSIFSDNFFDDFFEFPFIDDRAEKNAERKLYGHHAANLMKTDIKEFDDKYEVEIDLPGFKKDEITMKLENGTLTVSAAKGLDKDEENKEKKYVRRERYAGGMSRSFYVGEHVDVEDIHPKYENGILSFTVPKKEQKAVEEKNKFISIEG